MVVKPVTSPTVCPLCQAKLEFVEKPGDKSKEVAFCSCRGKRVSVIERDAFPRGLKVQTGKKE